ncbi:MAG: ATP-binding protein [Luteibaculaceae bacterium]
MKNFRTYIFHPIFFAVILFALSFCASKSNNVELKNGALQKTIEEIIVEGKENFISKDDIDKYYREKVPRGYIKGAEDSIEIYRVKISTAINANLEDAVLEYLNIFESLINSLNAQGKSTEGSKSELYFYKGDYANRSGDQENAYYYYFLGKELAESVTGKCVLSNFSYRLGHMEYNLGDFLGAANSFKESYNYSKDCPRDFRIYYTQQERVANVALSYFKAGELDSALFYFDKAKSVLNDFIKEYPEGKRGYDIALGVINGNLAKVYFDLGDNNKAKKLAKLSIDVNFNGGGDYKDGLITSLWLANVYLLGDEFYKADSILNILQPAIYFKSYRKERYTWFKLNYLYHKRINKLDKAIEFYELASLTNDSLNKELLRIGSVDLKAKVEALSNKVELERLAAENQINTLTIRIFVILLVTAAAILFGVLYLYKKNRKDNKVLNALNSEITAKNAQNQGLIEELNKQGNDKDRILRAVVHDLRNPVATLINLLELIKMETAHNSNSELNELITIGIETGNNSMSMINEILEVVDTNKTFDSNSFTQFSLINELQGQLFIYKANAESKGVKLLSDFPRSKVQVFAERDKIRRVISNLLSNAIKFSKKGGIVEVGLEVNLDNVVFSVRDNGIGIPDNLKPIIFEPFTNAKRRGTANEETFGLGLSICKEIIEKHNGQIWFESEVDKGTIFFVSLPK